VPVTGKNLNEFLDNLKKIQAVADWVELRVDSIEDLKKKDLFTIGTKTVRRSIFTCRSRDEGGQWSKDEKTRVTILQNAQILGFEYVDIELKTLENQKSVFLGKNKLIVSYHDFEKTPDKRSLDKIIEKMIKFDPSIIKIATKVNRYADIIGLIQLMVDKRIKDKIIIGMGEKGLITRVVGPLFGTYLTFAGYKGRFSAPGQMEFSELKKIYKLLNR